MDQREKHNKLTVLVEALNKEAETLEIGHEPWLGDTRFAHQGIFIEIPTNSS